MTAPKEPCEKKFADLIRMCEEAKSEGADTDRAMPGAADAQIEGGVHA